MKLCGEINIKMILSFYLIPILFKQSIYLSITQKIVLCNHSLPDQSQITLFIIYCLGQHLHSQPHFRVSLLPSSYHPLTNISKGGNYVDLYGVALQINEITL